MADTQVNPWLDTPATEADVLNEIEKMVGMVALSAASGGAAAVAEWANEEAELGMMAVRIKARIAMALESYVSNAVRHGMSMVFAELDRAGLYTIDS